MVKNDESTFYRIKSLITKIDPTLINDDFDLDAFCSKLNNYANIFIAKIDHKDIGLATVYTNDQNTKKAYIPYIGVLRKYQKPSITKILVESIDNCAREQKMQYAIGEAHKHNKAAIYNMLRHGYKYLEKSSREGYNVYIKHYEERNK